MLDLGSTLLAAVERDPDALAIVDGERRTTYAQWFEEVGRVAAALTALPIERGERLVVALQNRHEMATLHWACQLIGVVMTPVNWRVKPDELDFVLTDAEAKAVVFENNTASAVAAAKVAQGIPRIGIGGAHGATLEFDTLSAHDTTLAASRATARDWSLMLYTSGTTGRGKGVPRRHYPERAAALAHVAQNQYGYAETTLGVMPLYHTMGVRSLLAMALINGCFVCLPRFSAARALTLIESEKVSNLYLVPTLYHDLLADPNFSSTDLSSVRKLGFAGAPMTDGLLQRLVNAFQPELFVNHYGSSEIYTFTICTDAAAKPGSAGKAGLNQRIRVVEIGTTDPNTTLDPNQDGQIIASLGSDEAFEGYWNRPDADIKALHEGWYFTGDIGYWDDDGDLFVTGRVDDMIISGGENVMPVEVESVLSLHPAVAEVAVAGIADERLGQRTVAYIKRRSDVDGTALDSHCRASDLADFKRPRDYVFVQDVPKSPVGKILRRLLIAGEYEVDD